MNLGRILLVPSKSRFELSLMKYGSEQAASERFAQRIWQDIYQSHVRQKSQLRKITERYGYERIIDRSMLTMDAIRDNELFVFLGGDNHFTYCAQNVLKYMQQNPGTQKYVTGVVLDPCRSLGALLSFHVDGFIGARDFRTEYWSVLEAKIRGGTEQPYPAVGDYFVGEYARLYMSRNRVYLDGAEVFPDKSSGILVACGAGTGEGSWYNNVHKLMFGCADYVSRQDESARIILTENQSKSKLSLRKGQLLTVDSYNDDRGILSPDSHLNHSAAFDIGTQAEIWVSGIRLPVLRPAASEYNPG